MGRVDDEVNKWHRNWELQLKNLIFFISFHNVLRLSKNSRIIKMYVGHLQWNHNFLSGLTLTITLKRHNEILSTWKTYCSKQCSHKSWVHTKVCYSELSEWISNSGDQDDFTNFPGWGNQFMYKGLTIRMASDFQK